MKKLIMAFVAIIIFTSAAQAQSLDKFFKKYSDDERFQYVSVGSGAMNIASAFGGVDKETKKMISKMKGIKILTLEQGSNSALASSFINELNEIVSKGDFETVVEAREKNERTYIYKRVDSKNNADMLIMSKEPNETNVIWLSGKISPEELSKMMNEGNQ
ncbi:MAG: hypothetical protein H6Q19_1688 [Bacteroidetes bacterium]|nr:hypothetical protein [Bacteroidota bacterium]